MHCLWKTNEVYLLYVVVVDVASDVVADSDILLLIIMDVLQPS